MLATPENTTLVIPYKDSSDFAKDNLQHLIEKSPSKILVIYDEGDPSSYIIHPKVTYMKNKGGRCWSKINNQGIRDSDTEYVILAAWRFRPTEEHFNKMYENLNKGYAFVDMALLHFTGFSKHVLSQFGFMDEGYKFGHCEDWDFYNRIAMSGLGAYVTWEIPEIPKETSWVSDNKIGPFNADNYQYHNEKWKSLGKELILLKKELNVADRKLFKGKYEDRDYLKSEDSFIGEHWAKGQCFTAYDKFTDATKLSFAL